MSESILVYSDYVCPFCYLGRRALSSYQAERDNPLRIEWHPFDLRAQQRRADGSLDDDAANQKSEQYYQRARQNVRRLQDRYDATEMCQELATDVDSLPAQLVSASIQRADSYSYESWLAFDTAVFTALWEDDRDIGSTAVLTDVASEIDGDIDIDWIETILTDEKRYDALDEQFRAAQNAGITGVPTFVNKAKDNAARGAVPPAQLRRLMES
jgi:Predicted dithiol-disulfide isomerase involved in polyketide biosynthesis